MPDSPDFAADVEDLLTAGYELAFSGDIPHVCSFAYFVAVDRFGHDIELIAMTPECRQNFSEMKKICNAWDGQRVRRVW